MAQLVVTAVLVEGRPKAEVVREYGVSRRWVITLVQRFLTDGEPGLVPRSRRPRVSPGRTPQAVEDEIVSLRKELDRGRHEAGAATIAAHLEQRRGANSAPAVLMSSCQRSLGRRRRTTTDTSEDRRTGGSQFSPSRSWCWVVISSRRGFYPAEPGAGGQGTPFRLAPGGRSGCPRARRAQVAAPWCPSPDL
jgi:transposase